MSPSWLGGNGSGGIECRGAIEGDKIDLESLIFELSHPSMSKPSSLPFERRAGESSFMKHQDLGLGAEIIALVNEKALLSLQAPLSGSRV